MLSIKPIASLLLVASVMAGCVTPSPTSQNPQRNASAAPTFDATGPQALRFQRVIARMEPIAERICHNHTGGAENCDYQIVLDKRAGAPSNAYQSQDNTGRPVLTFTAAILAEFRNDDELAFVLGHEAAHHIAGHIAQTRKTATVGALVGGTVALLLGGGDTAVDIGVDLGGTVGARAFSKDHELEADALGAQITQAAGYDALRGAAFFQRIPDPGDRFLGSHPPNAQRIDIVRQTVGQTGTGF
ncbi:M48 family metallopeptidase [Cognatishimia sp. WU-CL00825]|uniref:M48 family metalloprotease n=1 Tax=Cognatishimia sp. WU-CL00825 TaxID=3127658 RepID=UPI00310204DD